MKECARCKEVKEIESFCWRSKARGTRHSWCRVCRKEYDAEIWRDGRKKETKEKSRKAQRLIAEKFLIDYFRSHSCSDCGEDNIMFLEFDHLRDKETTISRMLANGCSINKIKEEINKCEVVCKHCHTLRTAARGKSWRTKWLVGERGITQQ